MKAQLKIFAVAFLLSLLTSCGAAESGNTSKTIVETEPPEAVPLNEDKPFAEAHLIMQVNEADPTHFQAALDIANNLTKHYGGPDFVDIEIVAFGAGAPMVFAENNANQTRISSLMEHGVRFYICGNTLDTLERKTGIQPVVLPGVTRVQTGVAFLIDEINRGYFHLHP